MGSIRFAAVGAVALTTCVVAGASFAQPPAPPAAAPAAAPGVVVAAPHYVFIPMEIAVNKPAAEVWAKVGHFCDLGTWMRAPCVLTGPDDTLGTVRTIAGRIKEVLVGKTTLSYTYTQPVGSNTAPYNLYHGTLEAVPVNATSSKLVYNLVFDNSMLADDAARARDITSKTNQFNGALANMKTLAETGAMPPAPAAPARGGGAAPAGRGG